MIKRIQPRSKLGLRKNNGVFFVFLRKSGFKTISILIHKQQ